MVSSTPARERELPAQAVTSAARTPAKTKSAQAGASKKTAPFGFVGLIGGDGGACRFGSALHTSGPRALL
jgi:hypothetical protein